MESPPLETVYQAISALYDNPNSNEKEKASIWLADVQKSIHSWKIADELLQQKKDAHSYYFAAQTMRSKVQNKLSELPSEALVSLRDSLLAHLICVGPESSAAVVTQLSLALVDLALQMPAWHNFLENIFNAFSGKNMVILEILTLLPQELDTPCLKLGDNRREEVKTEIKASAHIVSMFLKEILNNSQNTDLALKTVKCMTSWIEISAVNIEEIPENAVIGFCLQVLKHPDAINTLHDSASDCICHLLHYLEKNNADENVDKMLFDSIASLEESYHMAVANEDEEKIANFSRVFTELADAFLEKIISSASQGSPHYAMKSLDIVLTCVGHHDYEAAEITFKLWYRLSEEVYQRDYQPLTDVFKPHIERLVAALARHCQCDPDQQQPLPEGNDFYDFRMKVVELIKDVVFIIGSSCVFRQMFAAIQQHNDVSWEQTEAALFIMHAVAKNILPDENEYVPKVVQAILSMPPNTHLVVRATCIMLLGELCEWISKHTECLEQTLQCLIAAAQDTHTGYAAATALQQICAESGSAVSSHTEVLLRAAGPNSEIPVLKALASALSHLPPHQLSVAMREACAGQTTALRSILTQSPPLVKNTSTDPCYWLDRIAALFRAVTPTPDKLDHLLPAINDTWPVLSDVLDKFSSSGRVCERWCRCVRYVVRSVGRRAAPLLSALSAATRGHYHTHAHSCYLYLASILVDELSSVESCIPELMNLLQAVIPRAFQLLQQENGLKDNPDTVDDLFRLCIRFLQRIPLQLASSPALGAIVTMAGMSSGLDHRDANSSVMKFLYDLLRAANHVTSQSERMQLKVLVTKVISEYGEKLTHALIEAAIIHLHSYMISEVAEVVLELVVFQRSHNVDWIKGAIDNLPKQGPRATEQQCWQLHQYLTRAEKLKETTKLLREFARLYR